MRRATVIIMTIILSAAVTGCDQHRHWGKRTRPYKADRAAFGTTVTNAWGRTVFVEKKSIPLEKGYPYSWKIHLAYAPAEVTLVEEFILESVLLRDRIRTQEKQQE